MPLGVSTEQELLDVEQLQALQFMQMTLSQFCLCVLEKTIPALKSTNQGLVLASLGLLQQLHKLLAEAFTQELWDDVTAPGRELVRRKYLPLILGNLGHFLKITILWVEGGPCFLKITKKPKGELQWPRFPFNFS